jgi:hypothetical protein
MPIPADRAELVALLDQIVPERGDDIRTWPDDEAEAYREHRFAEGRAAARQVMLGKAADVLLADAGTIYRTVLREKSRGLDWHQRERASLDDARDDVAIFEASDPRRHAYDMVIQHRPATTPWADYPTT